MSRHYLLDGYNIINQMPNLDQGALKDRRQSFIKLIEQYQPQGSLNNSITVVFDGKAEFFGSEGSDQVQVIFTTGETADDRIKRIVANSKNKKQVIVVTDDRAIKYYVKALGASVISAKIFSGKLISNKAQDFKKESKRVSKTLESKINSEFEEIWLKKNKKKR